MKKFSAVALVLVFTAVPSLLLAETQFGLNSVHGRVGLVMPEDPIESTIGFGAGAHIGELTPDITLHGYLDFWSKSYAEGQYYDFSYTVIAFAAIAHYNIVMEGSPMKPYVGGGLGLNFATVSSDYSGPSSPFFNTGDLEYSETDTDLGLHLLGGLTYPLNEQLDLLAELRYTIAGNVDYFGIWGGVSYKLK